MTYETPLMKLNKRRRKKFQAYVERHIKSTDMRVWNFFSFVPLLDIPFLRKWRNQPWSWPFLSKNKSFSVKEKLETLGEFPWSFQDFFNEDVDNMQTFKEIYFALSSTTSFNFHIHEIATARFSVFDKNIVEDVKTYPDFDWNWGCISLNKNITEDFIFDNKDKLKRSFLATNSALSIKFIKETMHTFKWDLAEIASNRNLNEHNFLDFFDKKSFRCDKIRNNLSENLGISLHFILQNPQFGWNEELISFREDIRKEHIEQYPNFPWLWYCISGSKSIDKHFLKNHPKIRMKDFYMNHAGLTIDEVDHLPPTSLLHNALEGTVEDDIEYLRKYYAVRVISNAFFQSYWHVEYALCRKRLNERYDRLFQSDEQKCTVE